jgi:hypothetical protein
MWFTNYTNTSIVIKPGGKIGTQAQFREPELNRFIKNY